MTEEKKVLLVEDSKSYASLLIQRIQSELRLSTVWAQSMAEAEEILKTNSDIFHIALTDLHLPDSPNAEVLDIFKDKNIPVVPMTGDISDEMQEMIWGKKVVDYVIKEGPHTIDYLLGLIKRIINNPDTKILIVDDSKTARAHIHKLLARHHYQVLEAGSAEEALNTLSENPDTRLVLTDYNMPDMNGFDLTRKIRMQFSMDKMAIIGLSAEGNHKLAVRFMKHGANDFMSKPFLSEQLYIRVSQNISIIEHFNAVRAMSLVDYLTGLKNRRSFFNMAPILHNNAKRKNETITIAMIDIDYFKKVNDTYGHRAGDMTLSKIGSLINSFFRESDLVARFGGEEFITLAPHMEADKCLEVFNKLREKIEGTVFNYSGQEFNCTISVGICNEFDPELNNMIKKADEKLYVAKNEGRNRVII